MTRLIRRLFARNDRLTRWLSVKALDANSAARRQAVAENRARLHADLAAFRKRGDAR